MKRICTALMALALAVPMLLADGPDDLFIRVYALIQQGDASQANGQLVDAAAKYTEAKAVLDKLQAIYPKWNEKIVSYRQGYLAEQLARLPAVARPPATPAASTTQPATAAAGPAPEQLSALDKEVRALREERDQLQAKLREALTAQPAAVDPRELARAERRVQDLLKENQELQGRVKEQQEKRGRAGADAKRLEQAEKALEESKKALAKQDQTVANLTREKQNLEQQLKKATEKADARARREEPKALPAPANTESTQVSELNRQMAELDQTLRRTREELATQRSKADVLQAEKTALEKRVAELTTAKPGTPPAAARTADAPVPAPSVPAAAAPVAPASATPASAPETRAQTKRAREIEKAQMKQLERERNDLRKRVAALTRELEDRRTRRTTTQSDQLADELAILRARIQVYEARQVPYEPEEMALFKQSATASAPADAAKGKRSVRQLPAGAAALVAEAQRAFQGRRFDEAERKYQQALSMDERNVGLLVDLGATHLEQNRLDAADTVLHRALAADPNDADVLSLVGLLRFRQGKYDEALDALSRSAQLNPDNATTQNYLGVTLSQKGLRGPSETAFRKAIQLEPAYAEAHYNLAVVYARQRPPFLELARWHYQKALAAGQSRSPEVEKLLEPGGSAEESK